MTIQTNMMEAAYVDVLGLEPGLSMSAELRLLSTIVGPPLSVLVYSRLMDALSACDDWVCASIWWCGWMGPLLGAALLLSGLKCPWWLHDISRFLIPSYLGTYMLSLAVMPTHLHVWDPLTLRSALGLDGTWHGSWSQSLLIVLLSSTVNVYCWWHVRWIVCGRWEAVASIRPGTIVSLPARPTIRDVPRKPPELSALIRRLRTMALTKTATDIYAALVARGQTTSLSLPAQRVHFCVVDVSNPTDAAPTIRMRVAEDQSPSDLVVCGNRVNRGRDATWCLRYCGHDARWYVQCPHPLCDLGARTRFEMHITFDELLHHCTFSP